MEHFIIEYATQRHRLLTFYHWVNGMNGASVHFLCIKFSSGRDVDLNLDENTLKIKTLRMIFQHWSFSSIDFFLSNAGRN